MQLKCDTQDICTDIGAINQLLFPLCKAAALLKFLDSTDAIIN